VSNAHLRFGLALALQLGILAVIPAGQLWIRATGQTVLLKTAPVDPYSILSGYYMTLSYEISSSPGLPGADKLQLKDGDEFWVLLAPGKGGDGVWEAMGASASRPKAEPGQVALRGRWRRWRGAEYGIETYYIPEDVRQAMAEVFRNRQDQAVVEVKIARSGSAAIVRIRAGDRTYEY